MRLTKMDLIINEYKNGNKKLYNQIINYYYPFFYRYVFMFNDKLLLDKYISYYYGCENPVICYDNFILDKLNELFDIYVNNNFTNSFLGFIKDRSKSIMKRPTNARLEGIGENVDKRILVGHYANLFYREVSKTNNVFPKDKLIDLAYKYVEDKVDKTSSVVLYNCIISKAKTLAKHDSILIMYKQYFGNDDFVVNELKEKYKYLLEEYSTSLFYKKLINNFDIIIKDALDNSNIHNVFELSLMRSLKKYYKILSNQSDIGTKCIVLDKENVNIDDIMEKYSYLIDYYYKKYYGLYPNKELLEEIKKLYKKYINEYINNNSKYNIVKYISVRMIQTIGKKYEKHKKILDNIDLYNKLYDENLYVYKLAYSKLKTKYPNIDFEEQLLLEYRNAIESRIIKEKYDNLYRYLLNELNRKFKEKILIKYVDDDMYIKDKVKDYGKRN